MHIYTIDGLDEVFEYPIEVCEYLENKNLSLYSVCGSPALEFCLAHNPGMFSYCYTDRENNAFRGNDLLKAFDAFSTLGGVDDCEDIELTWLFTNDRVSVMTIGTLRSELGV